MRFLLVTDRRQSEAAGRTLPETVAEAVAAGAPAVLLREKDLARPERLRLAARVADACGAADLLVASDRDLARAVGASGVHLAQADPWPASAAGVLGRSCHDAGELTDAEAHGADYVTVSPVWATDSKPGYGPALGPGGLATLAHRTSIPVLALGGVRPDRVGDCIRAGAAGIAVMGAVMAAPDPGAAVAAHLAQLDRAPQEAP